MTDRLWRVWKSDGRYRLVEAASAEAAMRRVKGATSAKPVYDRRHPAGATS